MSPARNLSLKFFLCMSIELILLTDLCTSLVTDDPNNNNNNNNINDTSAVQQEGIREDLSDDGFIDNLFDQLRINLNTTRLGLPLANIAFLKRGQFFGLESIHRQGTVRNHGNDTLEFTATIDDPEITFNWTSTFLFTHTEGSAILRAQQLPVSLRLKKTSPSTADLLICDVPQLRGVWVDIDGAGMLNFLTGRVAAVILGVTRSKLLSKIQDPLCNAIATHIG